MTVYADLVLDNGGIVRIECPDEFNDQLYDSLEYAKKRGGWWSPGQFEGCHAEFLGMRLDRVDMSRVVGMM